MNLKSDPTPQQLMNLLAKQDDNAGHHVIWVGHDGEVHIDLLPRRLNPAGFSAENRSRIKFRLETCDRGNGYVGPSAATDSAWVDQLYGALLRLWEEDYEGYCDAF
ncbi:MAG: hypothetical protein ACLGSD_02535 [Acidobacteriota bacterium]